MTTRTSAEPTASQPDSTPREHPLHEVSQKTVTLSLEAPPSKIYSDFNLLIFAGLGLLGLAALMFTEHGVFSFEVTAAGLACCAAGIAIPRWLRAWNACTLVLERDALVFNRGKAHHVLPYASLTFAVRVRLDRSAGGMWRTLLLKTPEVKLRVSHFTPAGTAQQLTTFRDLLAERVAAAVRPRLAVEGLQGQGWRLDDKNLYHGDQTIPLSSIVAFGWFWKRIVLWRSGESTPLLLIDSDGPQAHVLTVLASQHLPDWEDQGGGIIRAKWNALPSGFEPLRVLHGDAIGEHLRMARGSFSALHYVALAFALQSALVSGLCAFAVEQLGHTPSLSALASHLFVPALLSGPTLAWFIFRDRWEVIEAYSSRYCSGLMNLSVLYVPIVAWVYANVRGVRKLSGT